eukprot:CAMPEP_0176449050 /NCGR_PEP_ID=MMETSP0127-20121128/26208_1 /TAXON_ID=938130 /ORGANISM="Platyophrya macrostoma, Strain WH" /LENGTH=269 /DNA_ID=CAMNT_0017836237 /DNA_START=1 /DNA_END=810 /DNA_ORIENTATION=-
MESLVEKINRAENSKEMANVLAHLKHISDVNEAIASSSQEGRSEGIQSDLRHMSNALMKLATGGPTTNVGVASYIEGKCVQWKTSIPNLVKDMDPCIKNKILKVTLSKILKATEVDMLVNWLEGLRNFELLYRGSEHGYYPADFHKRCDNKGPTLVLFEATTGERFGGYAPESWVSETKYHVTDRSFLFSLDLKEKVHCIAPMHGQYSGKSYGPSFGFSCDLGTCVHFTTDYNCYSVLGGSYQQLSTGKHLTEKRDFTVKEIEVHAILD